ncbi:class I SAM-dependent methyltransferase [uncultured Roseovarius sp.]|uniref:class I SAM-dependent methyltransferase n=1 Tax=uncultured Roseovarius sp. TaxID=293344 RepID=UPI0025FD47C4|nr:class I SAM-dependent methyltransferase [uncultured Roseovarius sp.]
MAQVSRLTLAVEAGDLALPEVGRIAVFAPRGDTDLSALPKGRVQVITGFKPDVDAFAKQEFNCAVAPQRTYAAAVVFVPRAKAQARALVAKACAVSEGIVIVDGAKTDGVDSILKAVRGRVPVWGPVNKAHGKLFWFEAGAHFTDWAVAGTQEIAGGYVTAPGVFSADGVDPASRLLGDHLPEKLGAVVADLGAGWGYLSRRVLERESVERVHLVEADHAALDCAKQNVSDPRAAFYWADATTWHAPEPVDSVVMNPPFHTGRAADPDLGRAFIAQAAGMLKPKGQLWMVANRHLPYETALSERFGEVTEITGDNRFKVLRATRPARKHR